MQTWMTLALEEAKKAKQLDEVPIGAVITGPDGLVAATHNQTITQNNPCAHAEILAITQASQATGNHRLTEHTLYITLEPCMMCYGAIIQARIPHVVFGAYDKRTGVFSTPKLSSLLNLNHHPEFTGGILETQCQTLLTDFFNEKRSAE